MLKSSNVSPRLPNALRPDPRHRGPPSGHDWIHEPKLDGWRLRLHRNGDRVALLTQRGNDIADRFPGICSVVRQLAADCILDAELVAEDGGFWGTSRSIAREQVTVAAFDLVLCAGVDLRRVPLIERKAQLGALLSASDRRLLAILRFDDCPALGRSV
jgi:bifunctional non-homologous end joining protein LigD